MIRSLAIGVVGVCTWLAPVTARAQSRATFTPSLSIGSIYDDNIFARTVGSGDQMTLLSPGLAASFENPRGSVMGFYTFDMQRSFDNPGLNELDARRHGLFDSHYRYTERLSLSLIGRYDFTQTAGELNFTTGLLLDRQAASRWEVDPSVVYQFTPRTSMTALYDRTTERIIGETAAFEDIARTMFTYQKTPRLSLGGGYSLRHFINGDETHTSNAVLFGSSYVLNAATSLSVAAGPRLSSRGTLEPDITATFARREVNAMGYSVDIWRGESIILGVLGPVEVLSTTAGVTWPVRRALEAGVHGGLFDSTTLSQGQARVYHAEAVAAWSPGGPFIVAASYGADFQRGDIRTNLLSDRRVVRHLFQVRLTLAPRLSRTFKPDDPLRPLGEPPKEVQR